LIKLTEQNPGDRHLQEVEQKQNDDRRNIEDAERRNEPPERYENRIGKFYQEAENPVRIADDPGQNYPEDDQKRIDPQESVENPADDQSDPRISQTQNDVIDRKEEIHEQLQCEIGDDDETEHDDQGRDARIDAPVGEKPGDRIDGRIGQFFDPEGKPADETERVRIGVVENKPHDHQNDDDHRAEDDKTEDNRI